MFDWQCNNCGFIYQHPNILFNRCPVCGSPKGLLSGLMQGAGYLIEQVLGCGFIIGIMKSACVHRDGGGTRQVRGDGEEPSQRLSEQMRRANSHAADCPVAVRAPHCWGLSG